MARTSATPQKKTAWLAWFTSGLLLTLCNQLHANGKIYQVELIVFERSDGALGSGESWQKNIELKYPEKWQRLFSPEEAAGAKGISPTQSDDFLQALAQEREPSQPMTTPANAEQDYFIYLPTEKRSLKNTRDAIARRNQYRILFHETWLQPLEAIEKARPLILHGGRQYGDYYELQGTLTVGISRFLHVQTDLWLSEFSADEFENSPYSIHLPQEPKDQPQNQIQNEWEEEPIGAPEEFTTPDYRVNQAVVLRQKRRMRSGELHYLDHPRLGVLIKIIPQQSERKN